MAALNFISEMSRTSTTLRYTNNSVNVLPKTKGNCLFLSLSAQGHSSISHVSCSLVRRPPLPESSMEKMKRFKRRLSQTLRGSHTIDESLSELAEQMTIEENGLKDSGTFSLFTIFAHQSDAILKPLMVKID